MDYESKILLNNLIDAVNGTDWWVVGITFVNAAIMVWLGWNQYKLQKRQTEAQEYDIYRKLYTLLSNANKEIDGFLFNLWDALCEPTYKIDKDFLQRKQTVIDNLRKDLSESYIDYELKFSKDIFNKDGYLQILSLMSYIIQHTILLLGKNEIQLTNSMRGFDSDRDKKDEIYAISIVKCFPRGHWQIVLKQNLELFIQQKRIVRCDNAILDNIKEKCKID